MNTENETEATTIEEPQKELQPIDPQLVKRVKMAISIPVPEKDSYWKIEPIGGDNKKKKKFLWIFKRGTLSEDVIRDLRKEVVQSPGNTLPKLNKLRKKYPDNGLLVIFSAICVYGNAINSGVKEGALNSFKSAVK